MGKWEGGDGAQETSYDTVVAKWAGATGQLPVCLRKDWEKEMNEAVWVRSIWLPCEPSVNTVTDYHTSKACTLSIYPYCFIFRKPFNTLMFGSFFLILQLPDPGNMRKSIFQSQIIKTVHKTKPSVPEHLDFSILKQNIEILRRTKSPDTDGRGTFWQASIFYLMRLIKHANYVSKQNQ